VATDDARTFLAEMKARLGRLCDERGSVPPGVAESLIASSAFWVRHPSGPCHAPGHAKRVIQSGRALKIEFGSNTFNISSAVQRCCKTIEKAAADWAKGRPLSRNRLDEQLRENLQRSVEGPNGSEYRRYPIDDRGRLVFGTQAIDAGDFLATLLDGIRVASICADRQPTPLAKPTPPRGKQLVRPSKGQRQPPPAELAPVRPSKQGPPPPKHPVKTCPHCGSAVSTQRFERHVTSKCPKKGGKWWQFIFSHGR
jgi:hypothetical protein